MPGRFGPSDEVPCYSLLVAPVVLIIELACSAFGIVRSCIGEFDDKHTIFNPESVNEGGSECRIEWLSQAC